MVDNSGYTRRGVLALLAAWAVGLPALLHYVGGREARVGADVHFWLVASGATVAAVASIALTAGGARARDSRTVLLGAAFSTMTALLAIHAVATPGILVGPNGVIALAGGALFLVLAFRADVHALIPLYAIGVVTSFTLSQSGMARRHLRLREPGWRKGLLINGAGALITLVVLVVIAITKFADGAWMVCLAIPALVLLLQRVQRTYRSEITQLKVEASQRLAPPKPRHEVVVLL